MTDIIIYTRESCNYCHRALQLLQQKNVAYQQIAIDDNPTANAEMVSKSGRTSVPQIFINDKHIGGCDDLYELEQDDKLDTLLKK
ncbi:glutaredoxin 3 [soil metagenome]